jgi:predicted negative regulator of RcsB-dependent stress response
VAEHLSDEEQLENLKKWWREYGVIAITVVALSIGGYFGSVFYKERQQTQAEEASVLYQQMMEIALVSPNQILDDTQYQLVAGLASQLKSSFSSSQYARYAALLMAKIFVEKNDLDAAAGELKWALNDADEGLELVIKLRLARIEASRGNIDLALTMIGDIDAGTMASAYSETQGDFHLMKEDKVSAYNFYLQSLSQSLEHDSSHIQVLRLKLNQVTPAASDTDKNLSGEEH